jgi:acyl-CoA synthetase (AMP-forming)/AMP-acid ligase II
VPPGEPGELHVHSDTVSAGYEGEADSAPGPRWASSGDLARLDDAGFLQIIGRARDMIVSGGVNLFPAEVEAVLMTHPSVREVAVAGVPDPHWGEAMHAWVVPEGTPPSLEEAKAWVRRELAQYKAPRALHIVEMLPRTPTGKVLKRRLVARSD